MSTISEQIIHGGFHQGDRRRLCPRCGGIVTYGEWCPFCKDGVRSLLEPCHLCEPDTLARMRGLPHFAEEKVWDDP